MSSTVVALGALSLPRKKRKFVCFSGFVGAQRIYGGASEYTKTHTEGLDNNRSTYIFHFTLTESCGSEDLCLSTTGTYCTHAANADQFPPVT